MTVYGLEHVYHLLQGLGNIVEGRGDTVEEPEDGVGFGGMLSSGLCALGSALGNLLVTGH